MNPKNKLILSVGCGLLIVIVLISPIALESRQSLGRNNVVVSWKNHIKMTANRLFAVNTPRDFGQLQKIASTSPSFTEAETLAITYPLKVSTNGRYLVDQNDQPIFWSGDTAWSLIVQGTINDIDSYFANRQQKRVNVILVNLIDHRFGTYAPSNIYGDPPFTSNPFTTPNEDYFVLADYVISSAAQKGMAVLLDPLYLGYACNYDGWCAEVQAATTSDMESWGQYVGNRYANFDNIVWIIGGDVDPTDYNLEEKITAFINGLQSADTRHLITAHNDRGQMAVTPWNGAAWLTLNDTYTTFEDTYLQAQTAYGISPAIPFFHVEGFYENDTNSMTDQKLRAQAYWSVLQGGTGYIFGNCPVWGLGEPAMSYCPDTDPDWMVQLDYPGAFDMMFVQDLFNARPWYNLVPDFTHILLTAGYGNFGELDYATAGVTADGDLAIAYLPTIRTVTVDLTQMSSSVNAYWYDPTNGVYTIIEGSPFPNTGSYQLTPPGNNYDGDGDWILVLESILLPTATPSPTYTATTTPTLTISVTPTATQTQNPAWTPTYTPMPVSSWTFLPIIKLER